MANNGKMHSNIWNAVGDAVRDNDIGTIASEFGKVPPKEGGLATAILIDIALMAWGIVMGPAWNKRTLLFSYGWT